MTGSDPHDPPSPATGLREQAAAWFARMRRPDAATFQAAFDAWLADDERHRVAYNRIAERFSEARILARSSILPDRTAPSQRPAFSRRPAMMAGAALLLLLALLGSLLHFYPVPAASPLQRPDQQRTAPAPGVQHFETKRGEIRTVALSDGSSVTLDTGTRLTVAFTTTTRSLDLERGRARFTVAHEGRAFIVAAGTGTVTAHGTVFDVALDGNDRVRVSLLRGAIEVAVPRAPGGPGAPVRAELRPGQEVAYVQDAILAVPPSLSTREVAWPEALIDFDGTPLSQVVAEANRYADVRLRLADPTLSGLTTSGRFRINDPEALADNLARLFNLTIDRSEPGSIILRPKHET